MLPPLRRVIAALEPPQSHIGASPTTNQRHTWSETNLTQISTCRRRICVVFMSQFSWYSSRSLTSVKPRVQVSLRVQQGTYEKTKIQRKCSTRHMFACFPYMRTFAIAYWCWYQQSNKGCCMYQASAHSLAQDMLFAGEAWHPCNKKSQYILHIQVVSNLLWCFHILKKKERKVLFLGNPALNDSFIVGMISVISSWSPNLSSLFFFSIFSLPIQTRYNPKQNWPILNLFGRKRFHWVNIVLGRPKSNVILPDTIDISTMFVTINLHKVTYFGRLLWRSLKLERQDGWKTIEEKKEKGVH